MARHELPIKQPLFSTPPIDAAAIADAITPASLWLHRIGNLLAPGGPENP
jgi:hypothetical protein